MNNRTIFMRTIAGLIESANDKFFTLNTNQIIEFVEQTCAAITKDYKERRKKASMSGKRAMKLVKEMYLNEDGELNEDVNFLSDQEAMTMIYESVFTLMTEKNYKKDAEEIINGIKNDESFAYKFFYGDSSIAIIRSRIINQVKKSYNVDVEPYKFNTLLYEQVWSDGTWSSLNSYKYRSSFFQWLSIVASNCIMAYLEKNGLIKIPRTKTPSNTRLKLKQMSPEYCRMVIEDMVNIGPARDLLIAVYVYRLDKSDIQKRFKMDDKMYDITLKTSEKILKLALINQVHNYDDVLVEKKARKISVSCDLLDIIGCKNVHCEEVSPLREVLGVGQDEPEFERKVVDFLYDFSDKMEWSEEEKYIWQSRYIKNIMPLVVAESLHNRSRAWVDTKYSRLNRDFKKAIREWWNNINK